MKEADVWEWLSVRAEKKNPQWLEQNGHFTQNGWEAWVLRVWPKWLTIEWYRYLFGDPGDRWHRAGTTAWLNLPVWGEWRYWLRNGESLRLRWIRLTEETRLERIWCRLKGHPNGMVFYNVNGYEPDTSCVDCGEEIG